jgi:dihydroflavonol-4-reductase
MTTPQAAGERFLAVSDFMWMGDIAKTLRAQLGDVARRVPTRTLPDFVLRLMARFDPEIAAIAPALGRRHIHSTAKARNLLGWQPRPGAVTVIDCANSLIAHHVIPE